MKKIIFLLVAVMFAFGPLAHAGNNLGPGNSPGPAPNSGDGIPDGSGFEDLMLILESMGIPFYGPGPAPNSGDGIPDGSGFEAPPQGVK